MSGTDEAEGADGADSCPPSLDGYLSGRRLGTGASASVWLVTAEDGGGQFAAKVFSPDADSVTAAQLRREMDLLHRLDHEHLVRLHKVLEPGEGTTLLMEYAAGGSLVSLVAARGPLPVDEAVTILTPVARCLAYLHGHGVTHSDVAPGNVLFTEHGKPLLADLGLGRLTGEAGTSTAGTAGFSPAGTEEAQQGRLQPEDDVYGLAAVGWYALTGRVPAAGDRRPPLSIVVPDVPEELAMIIEAGLQSAPDLRPSAAEFEQAVFHSADPSPINLVPAVHESVLPHLLTRRNVMEQERHAGKGRRRFPWRFGHLRRKESAPGADPTFPAPAGKRQDGRRPGAPGDRRRALWTGRRQRSLATQGQPGPGQKRIPSAATKPRMLAAGGVFLATVVAAGALLAGGHTEPAALSRPGTASESAAPSASIPSSTASSGSTAGPAGSSEPAPGIPAGVRRKLDSTEPGKAVHALAWLRAYAFSSGRTELLKQVNAPGSPAMAADRRIAQRIEQDNHVFAGFETRIRTVERLRAADTESPDHGDQSGGEGRTVFMALTAVNGGFVERDGQGRIVQRQQQEQVQRLTLQLRIDDGRWLIDSILPAGTAG